MDQNIKDAFKSFIFDGILLILLGVAMLLWPSAALKTLFIIIGAAVGVMGIIKVVAFFVNKNESRSPMDLVIAFAQVAIGVALIVKADMFIEFFNVVLAIILAYGAVLMFAQAIMLKHIRGPLFVLSMIFSVITMILAVIIFIDPAGFAVFMTQLRGIALIVEGIAMIIVLRNVNKQVF